MQGYAFTSSLLAGQYLWLSVVYTGVQQEHIQIHGTIPNLHLLMSTEHLGAASGGYLLYPCEKAHWGEMRFGSLGNVFF